MLSESGLQLGIRAGTGEHGLRAAQCECSDLCCRRACLGGVEQRLGEGERTLYLGVACDA
jgi:hypothetical protein